ncbi:MAG: heme exporter protein CcmD [Alphaproteobacteria bacterium]
MSEFLALGGHSAFVWPAWGLTLATLVAFTVSSWRARTRAASAHAAEEREEEARREAGAAR